MAHFLAGAELIVSSDALARSGPAVVDAVIREKVTVWHCVPSLLANIEDQPPDLRLINLGGEACPPNLIRRWERPGLRILNTYGPTETTVTATWAELKAVRPVTIGLPLPGYRAWIVDDKLVPVLPGVTGELLIGGPGVGSGYVGLPDQTAKKFAVATFDKSIGPERVYRSGDSVALVKTAISFLAGESIRKSKLEATALNSPKLKQSSALILPSPRLCALFPPLEMPNFLLPMWSRAPVRRSIRRVW